MSAINTLFPVFFMMILGYLSKRFHWVSPSQKEGVNHITFNVLFPILIFSVLLSSTIEFSSLFKIGYAFLAFSLAIVYGKLTSKITGKQFAHLTPYMMTTTEGGNVALPLYTSIVGMAYASNTVIFDIAGTVICFIVMPILVTKQLSGQASIKELLKKIMTNSFVIACFSGILFNLIGLPAFLESIGLYEVYSSTVSMATGPIVAMILFVIGYNFAIDLSTLGLILKFIMVRLVYYVIVIGGFFILFPADMADPIYLMAVLIYYLSPTGFGTLVQVAPLYKGESDQNYTAAIISIQMVVTLIVYTFVVLFIA